MRIERIITHVGPHLDEYAAISALKILGEDRYPGVKEAPIEYISTGIEIPQNLQQGNCLFIGVGGGEFDEHSTNEEDLKQGHCAFSLVARDLGLAEDPALEKILEFITQTDTNGRYNPFDLSALTTSMNRRFPDEPEMVMNWVSKALEAKYYERLRLLEVNANNTPQSFDFSSIIMSMYSHFSNDPEMVMGWVSKVLEAKRYEQTQFLEAGEEFREKAEVIELNLGKRTVKMVTIKSDAMQVAKFARSPFGCKAAVVIQQKATGHVQIYADKRRGVRIAELVKAIRIEELVQEGEPANLDWGDLILEGQLKEVPKWFFHEKGQMMLNSCFSAPDVPPTKIGLERIKELAIATFSGENLPNHCRRSGRCIGAKCRWHIFTLYQCRKRQNGTQNGVIK